jgi:drug/metabolite transporter (DMT)-like permease
MNPDASSTLRRTLLGSLYMLVAAIFWGGMFPVAKAALQFVDPFFVTLIRYGIAAIVMVLILWRLEGRAALLAEGRAWPLFFFGCAGFCAFSLLVFTGLRASTPAHGAILVALMPLLTALITAARSRKLPALHTRISIVIALVGVGLVVSNGHPLALASSNSVGADGLILLGVLSWVIYTLGARKFSNWSPLRYSALTVVFGTIGTAVCTLLATISGDAHAPTLSQLADTLPHFAYIIVCASLVAVISWNEGVRRIGPVNGVLFINFVPVTAFVIQAALGVAFSAWELMGAALVVVALLLNNLMQHKAQAAAATAQPSPQRLTACPQS